MAEPDHKNEDLERLTGEMTELGPRGVRPLPGGRHSAETIEPPRHAKHTGHVDTWHT
jgi:hypothetical protein